jgi:Ca2+-binding EF-hand superfamily protein
MEEISKKQYFEDIKKDLKEKSKEYFEALDLDKNGSISLEEWLKCENKVHETLGDKINKSEAMREFKNIDVNNDGKITLDECILANLNVLSSYVEELDGVSFDDLKDIRDTLVSNMNDFINNLKK